MKKLAGWLAIVAMALNALWPLIAQARPATLVPVCTVGGTTHYVEIPGGTTPVDSQHEHCAFCFAGAALPASHVPHGLDAFSFISPKAVSFTPRSFILVSADARAPPVVPVVHFTNDNGRTHEEAFALPAADSCGSGGVLRVGILHG
ncbi:hypothetical protein AYO46_06415 [Betaproteobacteria bacterium SCGC AG-212-J23]|nr:hypothetical protein AYO46_06415 [Betaproteobacteria bacterium SCGC AG-212-J23]